jgi:uncharacterized protein
MTPQAAAPIPTDERIEVLDTIRGFALLGIFIMNMPAFNTSLFLGFDEAMWPHWWDRGTETVRDVIFSGKFNSMFSMLFAIGFTIQLGRLEAREPERATASICAGCSGCSCSASCTPACSGPAMSAHVCVARLAIAGAAARAGSGDRRADRALPLYPTILGIIRMATAKPEDIQLLIAVTQQAISADNAAFGHGTFSTPPGAARSR